MGTALSVPKHVDILNHKNITWVLISEDEGDFFMLFVSEGGGVAILSGGKSGVEMTADVDGDRSVLDLCQRDHIWK